MLELGVKLLIAYLIGTLLGSLLLGRLRGVDIRSMGSGNAGATNALRTQGKLFGFLVLAVDMAKGAFVVWWLPGALLPGVGIDPGLPRDWLTLACAFAVIVGHVYPVWFGFRGGKGAATVVGVVAALELRLLAPLLVSWFVVLLLTGYVGLATMLSGVVLVIAVYVLEPKNVPLLSFCLAATAFVIYTHRSNIARMRRGSGKSRTTAMAISIASLDQPLLLMLLADGRLHSGEWLARELNVSRAAVRKGVERLRRMGIGVQALPRRGYRLPDPVELLDARRIGAELDSRRKAQIRNLELAFEVDSTNTRLLDKPPPPTGLCGRLLERTAARRSRAAGAPLDRTIRHRCRAVGGMDLRRWGTYVACLEFGGWGGRIARLGAGRRGRREAQVAERYLVPAAQNRRRADRVASRGRRSSPRRDRRGHQRGPAGCGAFRYRDGRQPRRSGR